MDMVITSGKLHKPQKVVIYGVEGIGKSTFAAQFPDPVFIDTEGSTSHMDVKRLPNPTSWNYLFSELDFVIQNKPCKTLIIDTIDWAEQLAIQHICQRDGKTGLEAYGYGTGYVYAREEMGRLLNKLSEIIDEGINVVLTAHAQIRKFEQPDEEGAYDRYELKLGKKTSSQTAPLVKEWADMLLFANYKTVSVAVDDKGKKHKASGGKRVMYTTHHPCWDAKNRFGLPEECDFSYEVIRPIIESQQSVATQPVQQPETKVVKEEPKGSLNVEILGDLSKLPTALSDLMKKDSISIEKLQEAIAKKGFFPEGTPVENIPANFWNMTVANWENFKNFIYEMDLQF